MYESEEITRKKRIDTRLRSAPLNWKIIRWIDGMDTSALDGHAVEEYPTGSGSADYALFVKGRLLGIIEAKKLTVGAENVLEQAKRYSRSADKAAGEWRGYKVPFLYSTNGEMIFHLDIRKKENTAHQISDFHSPQALIDKFSRDTEKAELWFLNNPVNTIKRLRYYQVEAIEAIEKALCEGKRNMLLAMATGTGKTFTIVSLLYRLLRSGYAKKVLFLVDRRALAAQAVTTISAFQTPEGLKLDKEYEVYSQRFKREDLDDLEYDADANKLDIPINAFDVIIADECHRGYSAKETGTWKQVSIILMRLKSGLPPPRPAIPWPCSSTRSILTELIRPYSMVILLIMMLLKSNRM